MVIKTRILTALVALPLLVLLIIYASPLMFGSFVVLIGLLALHEYFDMALDKSRQGIKVLAVLSGSGLMVILNVDTPWLFPCMLSLLFLVFGTLFLFNFRDLARVVQEMGLVVLGFLYISVLLGHLILLRDLPFGRQWIFFVLACVMFCDSAAYFTGVSIGQKKLYPAISPNKSVEGAVGGIIGSILGAVLARWVFFDALGWFDVLLLGILLGVLGQVGDLFESMLKRSFGVKDSGRLVPGHGGLLDRLDSLLFAFAPVYYYGLLFFKG